jgi:cardiolipin synthase
LFKGNKLLESILGQSFIPEEILSIAQSLILINFVLAILLVFFEKRNPTSTWAWLMLLSFLPFIGFILYLFFGQNMRKEKLFILKGEEDKYQRRYALEEKKLKDKKIKFNDPAVKQYRDMIQLNFTSTQSLFTQENKVDIYISGLEKFDALIKSLRAAKKFIHLEYYIFRNDTIGKIILQILEKKAAEGVEVKLLYDAIGAVNLSSYSFHKLKKNHGRVAPFFPSFLYYINLRINYRNHRKIVIIDGNEAFIGGFNIGDEYLGHSKILGYWRDTHLKIQGDAVDEIQRQFLLDWHFASEEEVQFNDKYFPEKNTGGNTGIQIISSGPDSEWKSIKNSFFKIINSAEKSIFIQTPYLVPDESILQALKVSALSGIDVRVMIPSKPDHYLVHWVSMAYVGELLESGVRCFAYNKGFLHSKMIVADGIVGSVGSANMDVRSFNLNFEINALIYDSKVARQMEQIFRDDLKECSEITQEIYNLRSVGARFKESVSRLFSPLL